MEDGRASIEGERVAHLFRVLRVREGQVFELSDTRRLFLGKVVHADALAVSFAIEQELPLPAALPPVTLLAAVFKFDRLEWMLEKATELGVARIIPVIAARTDAPLKAAASRRAERWRRICWEAAEQSRRLAPPRIEEPSLFGTAVGPKDAHRSPHPAGTEQREGRWMLEEDPGLASEKHLQPARSSVPSSLLVGPEGGWTAQERARAREAGFQAVSLGPQILRAETAALAALALLLCAPA